MFLSMAIAVEETQMATVVPMVTSPFLRHPIVTANGIASLHAMSSGRAMLGFASGGSSVMSIGRETATLAQMAREITTFRDLFAGRESEFEGREVKPLRYQSNVATMLSAFGPTTVKLACETAEGRSLFSGAETI